MNETDEAVTTRGYEFDSGENTIFQDLAAKMNFVAYAMIILGVLSSLSALTGDWSTAVMGVCYIFTGLWTRSAARSFRKIVHTEGSDINHLMGAMTDLTKLYTLTKWALIIAMIGGFIVGLGGGMKG
jgi:hypothetical protein